jgi:opacity protein-like surface antigen
LVVALAAVMVTVSGPAAQAADGGWQFEVTPYLWIADVDGTASLHDHVDANRDVKVEKSLEDDVDGSTDVSVTVQGILRRGRFVGLAQLDVLAVDESRYDTQVLDDTISEVRMRPQMGTAAIGWQFPGAWASLDLLAGVRYLRLNVEMENSDGRSWSDTQTLTDPMILVRPSVQLIGPLRFNANMAIGGGGNSSGGGSKVTYELQPELQLDFAKVITARLGYRYTYYECTNGLEYNGSFEGFVAGLGLKF